MNAYDELMNLLEEGEKIEGIVFGAFGWGRIPQDGGQWDYGYGEPGEETGDAPPVPFHIRGKVLTLEEARPYMQDWSFYCGYGAPECYATYVWTNRRVIWVSEHDGATRLDCMPRYPTDCIPTLQ